jgi:tetratricopeptide (TPR) repeat protein
VKSSETRNGKTLVALLTVVAAIAVGFTRSRLTRSYREVGATTEAYALPSPEQTVVLSLGWRSALADLIFSSTLVSYGIHIQEKRRFEYAANYLETVIELDPKFRAPYRLSDTILTLGSVKPREQDWLRARSILERGMKEHPHDGELWTQAGQYMAYLAPGSLGDEAMKLEWRLEGARRLARGCELIGTNENMPFHCITAATILSKAGEREATIQFLERVLTVVDNEEVRGLAVSYLQKAAGETARDRVLWRSERFAEVWRADLSYVGKDALLVAGPPHDALGCAGRGGQRRHGCSVSWRTWGEESSRW